MRRQPHADLRCDSQRPTGFPLLNAQDFQFIEDNQVDHLGQLLKQFADLRGNDRAYFPTLSDNVTYCKKADTEPAFAGESALLNVAEIFERRDKTMDRFFWQRQAHGDFIQSQLAARFGKGVNNSECTCDRLNSGIRFYRNPSLNLRYYSMGTRVYNSIMSKAVRK
jgi:hypothetical protein